MKMKRMMIFFLLMMLSCPFCFAKEASEQEAAQEQETEHFMAGLLESNFEGTPYTALVRITDVERKGDEMLYPTFIFKCEVLETYKGKHLKRVEYWRGLEAPPQHFPIGKSLIVSLFINQEDGRYYLGDNGYDLPATEPLIDLARRLTKNMEKKKAQSVTLPE
ncbi:hypothetical protein DENIS_2041 [Desulfonema ishimotonii]|uniref:Uncharacterized protein n=1 Tax=Desulfonema ishimotonii TaxID=45657 RepID=A0A401FVT4_9BACT|nr:hypothetical protein [Desulfonema ishimotonii]GBC61081.1 hypothetical protein DENIS_2041 [Desulfonema ishimotonii]